MSLLNADTFVRWWNDRRND